MKKNILSSSPLNNFFKTDESIKFGEKVYDQVRVIEPGNYRVFRKKDEIDAMYDVDDNSYMGEFSTGTTDQEYKLVESGNFSLGEIPLVLSLIHI